MIDDSVNNCSLASDKTDVALDKQKRCYSWTVCAKEACLIIMANEKAGIKIIAENRKARHEYFVLDTYEAGIALTGTEVKSLRAGTCNLKDSYAQVTKTAEIVLFNAHIEEYEQGNRFNHDPKRTRKLLLHKAEIVKLVGKIKEKGLTLVPLKLYFTRGKVKVELALCKGKDLHDKRQSDAERSAKREIEQAMKARNR